MRSTRKWPAAGMTACLVVVAVHGLAGWVLVRASRQVAPSGDDNAIRVVYVSRTLPVDVAVPTERPTDASSHRQVSVRPHRAVVPATARLQSSPDRTEPAPVQAPVSTAPSRDSGTVFMRQGRLLIGDGARPGFARNLFSRPTHAPEKPQALAVRMRPALTPADVLGAIGQLVGGPGYASDPCPQIRRAIDARLAYGPDDRVLRAEMEREKLCKGSRD